MKKVPLKLDDSLLGGHAHPGRSGPSMEEPVSPWEGVFFVRNNRKMLTPYCIELFVGLTCVLHL